MSNSIKIRLMAIALFLLAIGGIVYYAGTHGRVSVENTDSLLTLVRIKDGTVTDPIEVKNGAIVPSGKYIVRSKQGKIDRLAHLSIPGWFQKVTKSFQKPPTAQTSRAAALTYERFFLSDAGSLVSYSDLTDTVAGYTTHPKDDVFGGQYSDTGFKEELTSPIITNDGRLLVINDSKVAAYSFKTNQLEYLPGGELTSPDVGAADNDSVLFPQLHRSSDINSSKVAAYEKLTNKLKIITGSTVESRDLKINNPQSIVFDLNDTVLGAINKEVYQSQNNTTENEDVPVPYSLSIQNLKTTHTTKISIGNAVRVSDLALSPNSDYAAVLKDGELWVYDTRTQEIIMAQPFTPMHQLFWDKDTLFALSSETGVNIFNTRQKEMQSLSLGNNTDLSFSNFTPLGGKIYSTAFNLKQDSKLPDGFVIDPSLPNDGVTEVLASKLPYEGEEYDINYLRNTIYIRINYHPSRPTPETASHLEELKKEANNKVTELIKSDILRKCQVIILN